MNRRRKIMKKTVLHPMFPVLSALLIALIILWLLSGCGGGEAHLQGTEIYRGPMYDDFIDLYEQVKVCKGYQGFLEPTIVIFEHSFDCTGVAAGGCYLNGLIGLVGPAYGISGDHNNLIDTQGALFSHELTHFFQSLMGQPMNEQDPCGSIKKEGFQI